MPIANNAALALLLLSGSLVSASAAETALPDAIAAPGETAVLTVHAEGAQVYECKAGPDGKLAWAFREPIATLMLDGNTVGRHYAGPNWEYSDGSAVVGKTAASAPGATSNDIPWLKIDVISQRGSGIHPLLAEGHGLLAFGFIRGVGAMLSIDCDIYDQATRSFHSGSDIL